MAISNSASAGHQPERIAQWPSTTSLHQDTNQSESHSGHQQLRFTRTPTRANLTVVISNSASPGHQPELFAKWKSATPLHPDTNQSESHSGHQQLRFTRTPTRAIRTVAISNSASQGHQPERISQWPSATPLHKDTNQSESHSDHQQLRFIRTPTRANRTVAISNSASQGHQPELFAQWPSATPLHKDTNQSYSHSGHHQLRFTRTPTRANLKVAISNSVSPEIIWGLGGPEEDHQLHHCYWTGRVGEREEEEEA